MPYQRLWDGHIHAVHAHVVAVVGGPSECQLGKVARADDKPVHLIGHVHQNLGAFARLAVFIRHIVFVRIHADILKMLHTGFFDADFANGDA